MPTPVIPTTVLFMYHRKQTVIFWGFLHVYDNFHRKASLKKGNIRVVSIFFEFFFYLHTQTQVDWFRPNAYC